MLRVARRCDKGDFFGDFFAIDADLGTMKRMWENFGPRFCASGAVHVGDHLSPPLHFFVEKEPHVLGNECSLHWQSGPDRRPPPRDRGVLLPPRGRASDRTPAIMPSAGLLP